MSRPGGLATPRAAGPPTLRIKVAATSGVGELPDLTDNQNCSNQRRVDVRLSDMPDEPPDRSCAPPEDFAELMCR